MANAENSTPWWKTRNLDGEQYSDWQELKTEDGLLYYFNRQTQETTWDKPEELLSEDEKQSASAWVWVPDPKEVYVPGRRIAEQGNQITVELESNEERSVNKKDVLPLKKSSLQRIVDDLTLLDEMSVPLILHCLKKRFEQGKIYSAIGTILISINPYTQLDLYTPKMIRKYRNSLEEHREVPPHVFVVADQAYKGLTFEHGPNQSIVISGESGAGKTEATKQCLSYLGAVAGSVAGVEKKVFDANPILEGFGNAKTVRNNNSSRFGKYVEIFMNEHLQLMGGRTQNYLLEKVRVARQGENERNYHIFYMLTKGAERELRSELQLGQPEQYRYCTQGSATTVPGINDKQDFEDVKEAFKGLEFDDKEVHSIFRLIAGILHLGNCEFDVVKSDYADDTSKVRNINELEMAAKLFQVDAKTLEKGITHASLIMPGNKTVEKGLNPDNARDQRDSLCKYVYSKLFDWLVQQINKSMEPKKKPNKSIGILDIFGFEIFNKNSLEQLCINFCNEKLQQLFNFTVFKLEEKVYKSENIGVDHVPFIDNQPILELIEDKPKGIMPLLDEEGKTPGGSEEKWRVKLTQTCGSNKYFKNYAKDQKCFVLSHYAGDVVYDTQGFLEKNKDVLDQGLLILIDTSKEVMLKTLFPKAQGNMSAAQRKQTLSGQFRDQLNALMDTLRQTEPHYIRCVKPNEDKEPLFFQPRNCFEQLTYSGVFEAVKIRKGGYPFRLKHTEFVERYKCLLEEVNKQCRDGVNGCLDIVNYLNLNQNNIKKGTTMMLYRAEEHRNMELKRNIIMEKRKMNETLKDLINTDVSKVDDAELYYERLARACRACKRYNINTPLSQQANSLLMKYIESRIDPSTKQLLEEAITEKNLEKLEQVCVIIEENQYETDRCKLALRMRDRLVRINQECERAVVTLETNHMEACLFAASELEYTNEYLDYFRWMFETLGRDTEKFVQEQIRQAVKMKDVKRRIRLDIKLKDLYFAKMAQMFAIQNCPILKEADKWAGETILPLGRDKLKAGMMQFSLEDIHTNLTTIPKKDYKKRARDLFSDLQIYMMDKPLPEKNANANGGPNTSDQYGLNILLEGHSTPDLRNEIYCQLIKQLTNNPKPQSVNRGWNMVTLCLYSFAPSPELENYLEVFIRNQPEERRNTCLVALQSIMYTSQNKGQDGASQKRPPTLKDMQDILNGTRPLRRDFMETPPDVPSWADLLKSFNETDEDSEEYFESGQQPLAGAVAPGPKNANNKPASRVKKHHQSIASPAAPPNVAPPKFQFAAVDEKEEEKGNNGGGKMPPKFEGGGDQQPPKNPVAQAKPQGGPPVFNKAQPEQQKPPAFGGAAKGGGAIAELQAKLAAKGAPLGGGAMAQAKPMQKVEEKKVEEKKEEKKVEAKAPQQQQKFGGGAAAAMMANKANANANANVNANKPNANKGNAVPDNSNANKGGKPAGPPPPMTGQYKWLCHVDPETGDVFYENISTGATQWERPVNETVKPHWLAHLDPDSGELYFENIDTGETSWDKPDEFSDPDEKWSAKKDLKTGEFIYENLETGQSSKECPAIFQEKIPEQEWVRHFDPNSGEYYYENVRTGVTQWDPPQGVKFD